MKTNFLTVKLPPHQIVINCQLFKIAIWLVIHEILELSDIKKYVALDSQGQLQK